MKLIPSLITTLSLCYPHSPYSTTPFSTTQPHSYAIGSGFSPFSPAPISDSLTKFFFLFHYSLLFFANFTRKLVAHRISKETAPNDSLYLLFERYHLKGPKAGTMDVFADNLPGLPDNVRKSSSGGYWVGIAIVRRPGQFNMFDYVASRPWIRSFVTKVTLFHYFFSQCDVPIFSILTFFSLIWHASFVFFIWAMHLVFLH